MQTGTQSLKTERLQESKHGDLSCRIQGDRERISDQLLSRPLSFDGMVAPSSMSCRMTAPSLIAAPSPIDRYLPIAADWPIRAKGRGVSPTALSHSAHPAWSGEEGSDRGHRPRAARFTSSVRSLQSKPSREKLSHANTPLPHWPARATMRLMKVRALIRWLEQDGWVLIRTRGDHRQFAHPGRGGVVTVSGNLGRDIPSGTLNATLKAAGMKREDR